LCTILTCYVSLEEVKPTRANLRDRRQGTDVLQAGEYHPPADLANLANLALP
jgi:hypothetical protein